MKEIHRTTPIDVVIDYTWGRPAELIFAALTGTGGHTHHVRYINVGGMADDIASMPSSFLRSSDVHISGSGIGSLSAQQMQQLFTVVLPEMFQLAAAGKLKIETETAPLKDIEEAWNRKIPPATRLVITV